MSFDLGNACIFFIITIVSAFFIILPYEWYTNILLLFLLCQAIGLPMLYITAYYNSNKKIQNICKNILYFVGEKVFLIKNYSVTKEKVRIESIGCITAIFMYIIPHSSYISIYSGILSGSIVACSMFYMSYYRKVRLFLNEIKILEMKLSMRTECIFKTIYKNYNLENFQNINTCKKVLELTGKCISEDMDKINREISDSIDYLFDYKNISSLFKKSKKLVLIKKIFINKKHFKSINIVERLKKLIFEISNGLNELYKISEENSKIRVKIIKYDNNFSFFSNYTKEVQSEVRLLQERATQLDFVLQKKIKKYKVLVRSLRAMYGIKE